MAYILQTVVNARLQRLIDQFGEEIVSNTEGTLDQLRVTQGVIKGLRLAIIAVDEGMKEAER